MKKCAVVLSVVVLFIVASGIGVFADDLCWQNISRENLDLRAVLVSPDNHNAIYAGTNKGVIKTEDGGRNWRSILSIKGRDSSINFLLFSPFDRNSLYAASDNGLFCTFNQGKSWRKIFQGKNYLENGCRCVALLPTVIYLGTKAGLFVSKDGGRSWHKESGKLGNTDILAISFDKIGTDCIYVASRDGIFKTVNNGGSWELIFVSHFREAGNQAQEESQDIDEQKQEQDIRSVSCDPGNSNCVYVATSKGVRKSCDRGLRWEPVSNYGLFNQEVKLLLFSSRGELYAISGRGVFEYGENRWKELSLGLLAQDIRSLALDKQNNLYAACQAGLFKTNIAYSHDSQTAYTNQTISLYYKDEPNIKEVQRAAISYAEVGQEKIKRWRQQAAKKAILPKVSMGVDRNSGDLWHWETGSTTKNDDDVLRKGHDSLDWSVSLSWDLGEIIWNSEQTSIDVRSKLMVELRDNIMDEVTKLYFERIRVKMEMNNFSIEDIRKIQEKELKLEELTSSLDALTGGYFSSHITHK